MPQRGFVVEQNPLNIVTIGPFWEDLTAGIFARLLLVTIKSLRGTLLPIYVVSHSVANFYFPAVFQIESGQNYRCLTNDGLAAYKKLAVPKVKNFRVEEGWPPWEEKLHPTPQKWKLHPPGIFYLVHFESDENLSIW